MEAHPWVTLMLTHQRLERMLPKTVLTHYQTRHHLPPAAARQEMLSMTHEQWCDQVLNELRKPHPNIDDCVDRMDIGLLGHGMIRPVVGFLWGEARAAMQKHQERIFFAHSDRSGISIFEEAFYQGIDAAKGVLESLKCGGTIPSGKK